MRHRAYPDRAQHRRWTASPRCRGGRRIIISTAESKSQWMPRRRRRSKDWRFYAGITAMVLAVVMPLRALVVPMLGLSTTQSALLAGVLLAGGPEALCILAVAFPPGKDTFRYFTHRVIALRRAVIDQPASRRATTMASVVDPPSARFHSYIYGHPPGLMRRR